eukprot:gnl/MRDRNA2_/MRDRNA2_119053_c0_seq1.p1 gnl/MRDRNA2_/MRDRNA2_119053_c0~~gnl/MRDRNA2_/MRDRNA2_119053_c0_seq1.p1  ORF type:complete len:321 (+),score=71.24 gnl/MRDRNA2_/MRDRNA2_119053_c0_seq1:59-964(+)
MAPVDGSNSASSGADPVDDLLDDATEKSRKIGMQMVLENSILPEGLGDYSKLTVDGLMEKAAQLTTLHLEWMRIDEISNLEAFTGAQTMYLQYNRIEIIGGLHDLVGLQFLALQHNRIKKIENLKHLAQLQFLDLSFNKIQDLDEKEIPLSVGLLSLKGNPCTRESNYKERVVACLPDLEMLDGIELNIPEIEDGDALPLELHDVNVTRPASSSGNAYSRKGDMHESASASISEQIERYSREVLADVHGFESTVEGIVARSVERRKEEEVWLQNKREMAQQLGSGLGAVQESPDEDCIQSP